MKKPTLIFLLSTVFSTLAAAQFRPGIVTDSKFSLMGGNTTQIPAPIDKVFIPQGFDSNDNAEIIVSGTFPNSCYKMGHATKTFNKEEQKVYVNISAFYTDSENCLTIIIPYTQSVQLGTLEAGKYPVIVNSVIEKEIPIEAEDADEPEDRTDDFLYASVYGLIQKKPGIFEVQGVFPDSCYEIKEVEVIKESDDILVVLPKMSRKDSCTGHESKPIAWNRTFKIPEDMHGKVLIHVRTLNGGSINQVIDLPKKAE